jgi:hypothetical protein
MVFGWGFTIILLAGCIYKIMKTGGNSFDH